MPQGRQSRSRRPPRAGALPSAAGRRLLPCASRTFGAAELSRPQASQTPNLPGSRPGLGWGEAGRAPHPPSAIPGPGVRSSRAPSASENVWRPCEPRPQPGPRFLLLVSCLKPPLQSPGKPPKAAPACNRAGARCTWSHCPPVAGVPNSTAGRGRGPGDEPVSRTLGRPARLRKGLPLAAFEDVALLIPSAFYRRPFAAVATNPTTGHLLPPVVLELLCAPFWVPSCFKPRLLDPTPKVRESAFPC